MGSSYKISLNNLIYTQFKKFHLKSCVLMSGQLVRILICMLQLTLMAKEISENIGKIFFYRYSFN